MDAHKAAGVDYYELPVAYDALTVVMNPGNTWVKASSGRAQEDVGDCWGKIKTWKQVNAA